MCRIAAYVGPEAPLSTVLYDPPHALERQAYEPREQIHGVVNVDGTGVAWWPGTDTAPLRYVTADSPWADPNLPHLAARLKGRAILAAVRSATPGIGAGADHAAPFTSGRLAGAHNGRIGDFDGGVGRDLIGQLGDEQWSALGVLNDGKVLFLTVVAHYRGDLTAAVLAGLRSVASVLDAHGAAASLNLVVADGTSIVGARHSVRAPVNSLYAAGRGDAGLVASEPLDGDPSWKPIPEGHVVTATADAMTVTPVDTA